MGGKQTAACGEHRSLAVALYRSAFEHEVVVVFIPSFHDAVFIQTAVDGIVEGRFEFLAPSVEAEVEQRERAVFSIPLFQRDEGVVSCPCVVGRTLV